MPRNETLDELEEALTAQEQEGGVMSAKCPHCAMEFPREKLFKHMWLTHRELMLAARRSRPDCKNTEAANLVRGFGGTAGLPDIDLPQFSFLPGTYICPADGIVRGVRVRVNNMGPFVREAVVKKGDRIEVLTDKMGEESLVERAVVRKGILDQPDSLGETVETRYKEGATAAAFYKGLEMKPPGAQTPADAAEQQAMPGWLRSPFLPPLPKSPVGVDLMTKLDQLAKMVQEERAKQQPSPEALIAQQTAIIAMRRFSFKMALLEFGDNILSLATLRITRG